MSTDESIAGILIQFAKSAYWYGEETGDYDMKDIGNTHFYHEVRRKLQCDNFEPVGEIALQRIYSYIDETLDTLGIEHDESIAVMIVNSICRDDFKICRKESKNE